MNFVYPKPTFTNRLDEAIFAAKVYGFTEEKEFADFLYGAYFSDYAESLLGGAEKFHEFWDDNLYGAGQLCESAAFQWGLTFGREVSAFADSENVQEALFMLGDVDCHYLPRVEDIKYFRGLDGLKIEEAV